MTAMGVREYQNSKAKVPWGSQIKCSRTCLNSTFVISSFVALKCFAREAAMFSGRNHLISAITKTLLYTASVLTMAIYCPPPPHPKKKSLMQSWVKILILEIKHKLKTKTSWLLLNYSKLSFY